MICQKETLLALVLAVVCLTGVLIFTKPESELKQPIEPENIRVLPTISNLNQEPTSKIFQQKQSVVPEAQIAEKEQEIASIPLNLNSTLLNLLESESVKQTEEFIQKSTKEQNILSIILASSLSADCYSQGIMTPTIGPVITATNCCCCDILNPMCPASCCFRCGWCGDPTMAYIWDATTGLCGCEH